jgi:hypothetical protein
MRRRRSAIAMVAVAAAAAPSASAPLAEGAAWSMSVPAPGFCTPAPDDGDYAARAVHALGVPPTPTRPIAILDTGVDPAVPQLAGRVLQGYDALTGAPVSGDPDGHGTEAAGVAASGGPGMRGVSPGSPILPIRISGPDRAVTPDSLAKGIGLAVQRGAGVILVSGSGPLADPLDAGTYKVMKAVGDAIAKGVLVVAGAGDESSAAATMPGALAHVLTAGSVTSVTTRTSTSNSGPWIDVAAPGDGISGPLPPATCSFGFGFSGGTSFAAPTLAGAAALVQARRSDLTPQQLFELVRRAADDLGAPGRDNDTGFGMLDVAKALSDLPQAKESVPEPDDDPAWVRRAYANVHKPLLSKKKPRFKASASVSAAKDPADVFPVSLVKGDRVVVTVDAADPGALLELSILSPSAGDFDVTDGVTRNLLLATGGVSSAPQLEFRAKRSGVHYLAVSAADPVDPDDPAYVPSDQDPYRISAFKQHKKAKKAVTRRKAKAPVRKKR